MVSEKAEKDKEIKLRAGRYVRIEAETRLARVDEEYDLLRKFSNYQHLTCHRFQHILAILLQ